MNTYSRTGFKWSVNEILSLQRDFELLGLTIDQISTKHKRSPDAIMYKLDQEGFADYNVLYSNYYDLNSPIPVARKPTALDLLSDYDDQDDESVCDDKADEEYFGEEEDEEDDEDEEEDEVANLSERVEGLEGSILEIRDMIKQMISSFSAKKPMCAGSCN